mgnify:CR=1 FL=1
MVFGGLQLISFEDIRCVPSLTQPQRLQSAQAVEDKRQFKSNCRNLDYTETILSCTGFFCLFVCFLFAHFLSVLLWSVVGNKNDSKSKTSGSLTPSISQKPQVLTLSACWDVSVIRGICKNQTELYDSTQKFVWSDLKSFSNGNFADFLGTSFYCLH